MTCPFRIRGPRWRPRRGRFRRAWQLRRRALTLTEMVLYLTVTFSVIVFSYRVLQEEDTRQVETMAASDLRQVIDAVQLYMADNYRAIREDVVQYAHDAMGGAPNAPLFRSYTLDEPDTASGLESVIALGYLPDYYADRNGMRTNLNQVYRLMVRGVLRSNPDNPQATATLGEVEAGGMAPGAIKPELANFRANLHNDLNGDGNVDPGEVEDINGDGVEDAADVDDELDLEVFLVTVNDPDVTPRSARHSGDHRFVPPNLGNRIIARAGTAAAGFMRDQGATVEAVGPIGGWTYDPSEFIDAASTYGVGFPEPGNFASVIALSRYGVLSDGEGPRDIEGADRLDLCEGRTGADYLDCLTGNEVWGDVLFNAADMDGDGYYDFFPGLEDVVNIEMGAPTDGPDGLVSDGSISRITGLSFLDMGPAFPRVSGGPTDIFAQITNVSRIVMGAPVDVDGDGANDVFSEVRNLHALSCAAGGSTSIQNGRLVVDCAATEVPGGFRMVTDGSLDVVAESRFARTVRVVTDAPGLTVSDAAGTLRISDTGILLSDGAATPSVTRIGGGGIAADRIAATELAAETLELDRGGGAIDDVTANPTVRLISGQVSADGGNVNLTPATCPGTAWTPVFEVVGVRPPATYTHSPGGTAPDVVYDRLMGISSSDWNDSTPEMDVTYGRAVILPEGPGDCAIPPDAETGLASQPVPDRPGHFIMVGETEGTCDYFDSEIEIDTITVTNPAGTVITAMTGCEPAP